MRTVHRRLLRSSRPTSCGWAWLLALLVLIGPLRASASAAAHGPVILYTSQDEVYAEPILRDFERETGIQVNTVFDSEAVKTVGLANRLLAERRYPRCDVFWSNEELRTRQLAARQVFREQQPWAAMGYRSRRVGVNTKYLLAKDAPTTLLQLTNSMWKGKVALAYPLFGTTATHFLALRQLWGPDRWESWCRALARNQTFVVDGNSVAARFLGRGEAVLALTDSDDLAAEARDGAPVQPLPMSEETLLIPNTVAVIRNAPHPEAAQQLWTYLQRPAVVQRLVAVHALEGVSRAEVKVKTLQPDWDRLLQELDAGTAALQQIFLR